MVVQTSGVRGGRKYPCLISATYKGLQIYVLVEEGPGVVVQQVNNLQSEAVNILKSRT